LDGGKEKTKKRRWIVSQTDGEDFSQRSESGRIEQMQRHLESFIGIHKEFAEKGYVVSSQLCSQRRVLTDIMRQPSPRIATRSRG
jgi:hypothetical protein